MEPIAVDRLLKDTAEDGIGRVLMEAVKELKKREVDFARAIGIIADLVKMHLESSITSGALKDCVVKGAQKFLQEHPSK